MSGGRQGRDAVSARFAVRMMDLVAAVAMVPIGCSNDESRSGEVPSVVSVEVEGSPPMMVNAGEARWAWSARGVDGPVELTATGQATPTFAATPANGSSSLSVSLDGNLDLTALTADGSSVDVGLTGLVFDVEGTMACISSRCGARGTVPDGRSSPMSTSRLNLRATSCAWR